MIGPEEQHYLIYGLIALTGVMLFAIIGLLTRPKPQTASWGYRIVERSGKLSVHRISFMPDGTAIAFDPDPVTFKGRSREEVVSLMRLALDNVERNGNFVVPSHLEPPPAEAQEEPRGRVRTTVETFGEPVPATRT